MADTSVDLSESFRRCAAALGIIGGVALAAAYLTHPSSAPPETVASAMWIWIHVGFMVSLLAGVFLLTVLASEYLRAGGRWIGIGAYVMSVVSLIFVFGLDYSEVFIFPTLAVEFPAVVTKYGDGTSMPSVAFAFPVTGVLFVIGFVVLGWQLAKVNVISRAAGLMTIIGTVVFGIGLSGLVPMIVVRIGSVLFGAALVWLGLALVMKKG